MARAHMTNALGQTVALDDNGSWRRYNPTTDKLGAFAKAPVSTPAPADPHGPHRHESATLTDLAQQRATAAEHELIDAKAKLGVTENERDVAVKTAEVADTLNNRLVDRIDEVARQNGRLEGANEVLKEQLQEKLNQPAPQPTPVHQPAPADPHPPTPAEVAVERARSRPHHAAGGRGGLVAIIVVLALLLALGAALAVFGPQLTTGLRQWLTPASTSTTSAPASAIPNTSVVVTPPPVSDIVLNVSVFVPPSYPPEDSQECTLSDMIFVNGYCILLPEDQ